MSKIEEYIRQQEEKRAEFWNQLLAGPRQPISRQEALRQMRAAHPDSPAATRRDLQQEYEEFHALLQRLPWLKLRQAAEKFGIPSGTARAYLTRPGTPGARPWRNEADADTFWMLLRTTAEYIQAVLP